MNITVDKKKFTSREKALRFFLEGMIACDGSEAERYTFAYISIKDGYNFIDTYKEIAENR